MYIRPVEPILYTLLGADHPARIKGVALGMCGIIGMTLATESLHLAAAPPWYHEPDHTENQQAPTRAADVRVTAQTSSTAAMSPIPYANFTRPFS